MADSFTVTGQRPVQDVSPTGTFEDAIEVSFATKPNNIPGKVRIPKSQYSAANVAQVLDAQARLLESVHDL